MIGFSSTPRASSSPRTGRVLRGHPAPHGLTLSLIGIAAVLGGSACESALTDGNPSMMGDVPFGSQNSNGTNLGPNGTPISPVGVGADSRDRGDAKLSNIDTSSPTVDANGAPLPAEMLADLKQCDTPGPRQIRRLTSKQYRNTLVAVFGDQVPDAPVLSDPNTLGYGVDADDSLVQGLDADALMGFSETVATFAKDNGKISQFSNNCNDNNQNCQDTFIKNLGQKMSREPLSDARVAEYRKLFSAPGVSTFEDGAQTVIQAMVQSPYMLYRRELGPLNRTSQTYQLTQYEVASQLSYFLTNAPPDNELMQAAQNNQLNAAGIDSQAQRLIATDAAKGVFGTFVRAWTDVDRLLPKAKSGNDGLTMDVRNAMLEETNRLFADVMENGGTIGDLFSTDYTYLNKPLADFYGIPGPTGNDFQQVQLAGTNRVPGLLGQGSYLTAHALADNSSPVQRAFVVRERFLCNDLPPVPTNLDTNLKPQISGNTSRERYAAHDQNEPCHSCHKLMDPVGFTFEHYDGFGLRREMEAGKPVDSSGGVPLMEGSNLVTPEITFPLSDSAGLADYLSQLENVRACMISNLEYFSYGIANTTKWPSDQKVCTDNFIRQEARENGNTLESALMAVLHAPTFTTRVLDN
jgi:hypothetical protein